LQPKSEGLPQTNKLGLLRSENENFVNRNSGV
jgi:hypothetical protein